MEEIGGALTYHGKIWVGFIIALSHGGLQCGTYNMMQLSCLFSSWITEADWRDICDWIQLFHFPVWISRPFWCNPVFWCLNSVQCLKTLDLLDQLLPDALWQVSTNFSLTIGLVVHGKQKFQVSALSLINFLLCPEDFIFWMFTCFDRCCAVYHTGPCLPKLLHKEGDILFQQTELNTLGKWFLSLLIFFLDFLKAYLINIRS